MVYSATDSQRVGEEIQYGRQVGVSFDPIYQKISYGEVPLHLSEQEMTVLLQMPRKENIAHAR